MASFAPIRGTRAQIGTTPIVDGQFLVETNQGANNRIYLDTGSTRSVVGGGTGLLPHLTTGLNPTISPPDGYTLSITVTNPDGTSTTPLNMLSDNIGECNLNGFGTYIINIKSNPSGWIDVSFALDVNIVSDYTVMYNTNAWQVMGCPDKWSSVKTQNGSTVTFSNLDAYYGYKLYYINDGSGGLSIPKYTNINQTTNYSGGVQKLTLTYTISGGISGSSMFILRIIQDGWTNA